MPASPYQNISPMSTASTKIGTPERLGRSQRNSSQHGSDPAAQPAPPTYHLPASTGSATSASSSDEPDPFSDHNAVHSNSPSTAANIPRRSIYAGFPEYEEGYMGPGDPEPSSFHAATAGRTKANGRKGSKAESFASSSSTSTSSSTASKKSSRASRLLGKLDFKYQAYNVGVAAINPSPRLLGGAGNMGPGDPSAGCVIS